uniref:Uncharacterized protein n=1 Tax=Quercus lobata TaxID=97700 RepID=A0A7N2QZ74_QUELO
MVANSVVKPRVLIVSRRTVRKNKFVDFVGEYHLDLIVGYGAVPVIVPRVSGVDKLLESFEPIHGVLLCEGEDIDPSLYEKETSSLSSEELEEIKKNHASDTAIDKEKDLIELKLVKICLERNIPYLGICRVDHNVTHINYEDYDGHRHVIKVVDGTPLHHWFKDSLEKESVEILVNSYHHQGVKRLAERFVPMAFSPDGLVEGFYDPNAYNPQEGKFIVGLQFHPERMRLENSQEFDYPGCSSTYQEFVKAIIFYQKKLESSVCVPRPLLFTREVEKKRKLIGRSLSLTRDRYTSGCGLDPLKESEHEAEFLKYDTSSFSTQQEFRLMEMGATSIITIHQESSRENCTNRITTSLQLLLGEIRDDSLDNSYCGSLRLNDSLKVKARTE